MHVEAETVAVELGIPSRMHAKDPLQLHLHLHLHLLPFLPAG